MIEISNKDFDAAVAQGLHLVEFGAEWCPPCKVLERTLEELNKEEPLSILHVNVDNEPELSVRFGVLKIPVLLIMNDGHLVEKFVGGNVPGHTIRAALKNVQADLFSSI